MTAPPPELETEAERELWHATRATLQARHDDPRAERDVEPLAEQILARHRRARERRVVLAGTGVLALAAAAALVLVLAWPDAPEVPLEQPLVKVDDAHTPMPAPSPAPSRVVPADPTALLTLARGRQPHVPGTIVTPGQRLSTPAEGELCMRWTAPFALVCIEGGASLELVAARAGERTLALERGRLVAVLDPLAPGQRFEVRTALGSVAAIGTVFVVEASETQVEAGVLEGVVELREGERVSTLAAGQARRLGTAEEPMQLGSSLHARAEQVAERSELWRAGHELLALVDATPRGALALDGHPLGSSELALLVTAGKHDLALDGVELRTLEVEAGRAQQLGELAHPAARPLPRVAARPSAAELARLAQQHRMARNYDETARLYRELLDHYPDSPETTNVGVRLGDLLRERGDHEGALAAYDRYLERGGQLAPDARSGRIKSLRTLGRTQDEAAAIREFIDEHGDDYRAEELRTRLAELD